MAKQPKPAPQKRSLTDPEFDDYDFGPESQAEDTAEAQEHRKKLFGNLFDKPAPSAE